MSGYTPEDGALVEVRLRGHFQRSGDFNACLTDRPGGTVIVSLSYEALVGVERLPDPEPEWQPGDVILICSTTLLRLPEGQWACSAPGCELSHDDRAIGRDWETGDVTPVFRDGKPWAEAVGGAS